MKRVLITGGCGFIGSNFIRKVLLNDEVYVINIDALTYAGNLDNVKDFQHHQRYSFVHGDISDRALMELQVSFVDEIIHFAAESHVDRSILDASPFIHTNVKGTQVLLDCAVKYKISKFIQISTDEVYGSLGPEGKFSETSPLSPNSPYSASKAAGDLLALAYHHTFGLPVIITRCSNNYGPFQYPEKLIPLFISNILHDRPVPVYGDGCQIRDWIHVDDHCDAILEIWKRGRVGEVYNIGGDAERTNLYIARFLLDYFGKPHSYIQFVQDRPGHDRRYAINFSKLQHELGWSPRFNLEDGLVKTIEWYIANQQWIQAIYNRSGKSSSGL